MKKSLLIVAAVLTVLFSCKKDETTSPSKTELISAHPWRMNAILFNGIDIFPSTDSCDWDNKYTFTTGGVYTEDAGPWKCDPADPQIVETSTWAFSNNENTITFAAGTPDQSDFNLVQLEAEVLKYKQTVSDSIFGTFDYEVQFVRY
ncbi:MAG: hypothetical protein RL213_2162 [Bacteroidota bacterium]|jgi:hypothetical protein